MKKILCGALLLLLLVTLPLGCGKKKASLKTLEPSPPPGAATRP